METADLGSVVSEVAVYSTTGALRPAEAVRLSEACSSAVLPPPPPEQAVMVKVIRTSRVGIKLSLRSMWTSEERFVADWVSPRCHKYETI